MTRKATEARCHLIGVCTDSPLTGLAAAPDGLPLGQVTMLTVRSGTKNPQLVNGYFAPVYHEDWLCIINHLRKGEVAIGGSVAQLPYLPFSAPKRAEHEEFGDILLSGLLWLVHARTRKGAANKQAPAS